MSARPAEPEFSRPYPVERLRAGPAEVEVSADASECAALARRLGIPALGSLSCRFRLAEERGGAVLAEATLHAGLTRTCVASLDEFETTQTEEFRLRFVPHAVSDQGDGEALDPDAEDEIAFEAGRLDLGEAAAEQLALVLDPYPRKPGAVVAEADGSAAPAGPFAALSTLRRSPPG